MNLIHIESHPLSNNILIVGANGFLGSSLECYYKKSDKFSIHSLSRKDGDLTDPVTWQSVQDRQYDLVFFCAERSGNQEFFEKNNQYEIVKNNVDILFNLEKFIFASNPPKKFFCFSSLWTAPPSVSDVSESDLFTYNSSSNIRALLATKIILKLFVEKIRLSTSCKASIVTTGTLFGPGDKSDHLIPTLVSRLKSNPSQLKMDGSGSSIRNFTYVMDFCWIIDQLANSKMDLPESIIASSNINLSVKDVVAYISSLFGVDDISWGSRIDKLPLRVPGRQLLTSLIHCDQYIFKSPLDFKREEIILW